VGALSASDLMLPPPSPDTEAQLTCPQLQITSGLSEAPSQKVLQNLLSSLARHAQAGCAHLSFV
jgi:hypothetical protein